MDNQLKRAFEFYKVNQKDVVEKYNGKFIVIREEKIEGVYETEIEAYEDAKKKFELGTFLIQKVEEGENNYSQTFYSRVAV